MGIKDKDQAGTGTRQLLVDSTGLHLSPSPIALTAGSYSLDATFGDIFCDCSSGGITLYFPTAVGVAGKIYRAYKTDATTNTLTVNGMVLGGNAGVSVIVWISNGTAWNLLQIYDEGTYTATLTGCTTSPTRTISYVRNGKQVIFRGTNLFATSNTTACTITGMPSHLFPVSTWDLAVSTVRDNTLNYPGIIRVETTGVLTLSFHNAITTVTGTFTNSGTKGIDDFALSYTLQ